MMSDQLEFQAACVSVTEQDDTYIVGLADDELEPEQYIILQRAIFEDTQDDDLGLNTYFLEVCGPDSSGYGGIDSATLQEDRLELALQRPHRYLDGLEKIIVRFHLAKQQRDVLVKQLSLIFRDSGCVLTVV